MRQERAWQSRVSFLFRKAVCRVGRINLSFGRDLMAPKVGDGQEIAILGVIHSMSKFRNGERETRTLISRRERERLAPGQL